MKNILLDAPPAASKRGGPISRRHPNRGQAPSSSLTQQVYERIRSDILSCRLMPGQRLNIASLTKHLPASLGAVREALSRLTSEGLVEAEPQRGFRVTPLSSDDLQDLTMIRIEIEGPALRRSIANGDVAWESRVVGAYHHLSRIDIRCADDEQRISDDWIVAHRQFHEALVAACDSAWLTRVRRMLYAQSERYRRLSLPLQERPRDLEREHRQIMKAALDRDADRAVAAMTKHLQQTTLIILNASEKLARRSQR
jgi:DNA-binding GntR family transcriptional regulator